MTKFLVSGLINIETTLRISGFPLHYNPVNYPLFGIKNSISGVGYNVARALTGLGEPVIFLSIVGHDFSGQQVLENLRHNHIRADFVIAQATQTAQSIILYDEEGHRQVHADLKDIQEQVFPVQRFEQALARAEQVVLCNVNFSRPFLQIAKAAGKRIATDVHALASLDDEYNREFMQAADVLFMSDEQLPAPAEEFGREVMRCY
ncbi:MAG TPA: PfkB family carbohydrate kinase, partial [Anaerolineaceae bacterium]|nr:PfkB family carbohydrate kinase [Anaerolineaceae bacterium]